RIGATRAARRGRHGGESEAGAQSRFEPRPWQTQATGTAAKEVGSASPRFPSRAIRRSRLPTAIVFRVEIAAQAMQAAAEGRRVPAGPRARHHAALLRAEYPNSYSARDSGASG